ncbi:GTPase-activating protein gyp8 [Tilletia horrida]|nr:GTPase-activating protein gyp8 [Tilletia horrida]KAK0565096.1 GTPase-activating protein gyp8 [Tilletia horrida]
MDRFNVEQLRTAVLSPKGLGSAEERRAAWYTLLGVEPPLARASTSQKDRLHNIRSDVARSASPASATTATSEDSQLSLRNHSRNGLPTIQFGSLSHSDTASSFDSESVGDPESTIGSESVTTESQHNHLSPPLEHQVKASGLASSSGAAASEWHTVATKRKRAGSRATSQAGASDAERLSSNGHVDSNGRSDSHTRTVRLAETSSPTASTSALPNPALHGQRSINRFEALRGSSSSKSASNPARSRKQSHARRKDVFHDAEAGPAGPIPNGNQQRSTSADSHACSSQRQGDDADASHGATSRRSIDRIAALLGGDSGDPPRDASQVELDVNRSFLNFRQGSLKDDTVLAARRKQLSKLCIGVLERRRALSYYQGYHDVLTVLLLTLSPEDNEEADAPLLPELHLAAERLSLHWLRDAMTKNLDAVMGHLRLLRVLLQEVDSELASIVDRAFPLPYFALPWLITLLTHSLPDLALAQRVIDFVLVYGPMSALYLCVVIIQMNKEAVQKIGQDTSEDEMDAEIRMHQALSSLPTFKLDEEALPSRAPTPPPPPPPAPRDDQFADAVGDESLYEDPDVFGPADASATRSNGKNENSKRNGDAPSKNATPISKLLQRAADMMKQHSLSTSADATAQSQLAAIMGPGSVLYTWQAEVEKHLGSTSVADDTHWTAVDERAEHIVQVDSGATQPGSGFGSGDRFIIVHPELPATLSDETDADFIYEKGAGGVDMDEKGNDLSGRRPRLRTRTSVRASHKTEQATLAARTTTVTIAALGVAGVLLSMYAASNGGATVEGLVAAGSGDRAEQARQALGVLARWLSLMH